jgi:hypothetical protein
MLYKDSDGFIMEEDENTYGIYTQPNEVELALDNVDYSTQVGMVSDDDLTAMDCGFFEKPDRFDLEQEIMSCWNVVDDIKLVYENVMNNETMTKDEIANILLGIEKLYTLKFQKVMDTFEAMLSKGNMV